jgi:hypothetical protein
VPSPATLEHAAQAELWFCLASAACLVVAGSLMLVQSKRPVRNLVLVVTGVALIALVRSVVTRFSLIHANFHAAEILDNVYFAPTHSTRSYGVFHSLFYGGVMRLFGADFRIVAWANEIVAASTLLLMGFVGMRYGETPRAFGYVVGLGLMHPVLARLAGSEEGHNLAVFFSFVALAALETYRTMPRRACLIASAAALVLMLSTKEILVASLPCIVAISLVRTRPEHRRAVLLSAMPALPMLVLRFPEWRAEFASAGRLSQRMAWDMLEVAARTHPLLDPRGPLWLVAPFLIAGIVVLTRRSRETRIVVAALALLFASSFLLFEGQAVVFTFRLPVLTLALAVAGIGAASILELAAGLLDLRWAYPASALLLIFLTMASPGFDIVRTASAQTLEYDYIRSLIPLLPRTLTLVRLPQGHLQPSYMFPRHLLAQGGISSSDASYPVATPSTDGKAPLVFLLGLQCWGYSSLEVMGPDPATYFRDFTYRPTYGEFPQLAGLAIPAAERVECQQIRGVGRPIGARREISTPAQAEAPFVYYAADITPLEAVVLPAP